MNKFITKITKSKDADDALEKLKEMAERAKSDPEYSQRLSKALARSRTAGTTNEKAWD